MMTTSVLPGPELWRRCTTTEKLRLVEEGLTAGLSVAEFGWQRDIHPNLFHAWRHQARTGALSGRSETKTRFAPPVMAREARDSAMIEVVLRNGRLLGVSPHGTQPKPDGPVCRFEWRHAQARQWLEAASR
jgi:transposase-like protein